MKWISSASISDLGLGCATRAAIIDWDPAVPIDLYSDTSNIPAGCYISQIKEGEAKTLIYYSFTLLSTKRHTNNYTCELVVIVKFSKKYSYRLNAKYKSVVYINQKLLLNFLIRSIIKTSLHIWQINYTGLTFPLNIF